MSTAEVDKVVQRARYRKSLEVAKFRVKIKSLAEEARIIRQEKRVRRGHGYNEWGGRYSVANELEHHNREVVAVEQRHTLLAYALLRGKAYGQVEQSCRHKPQAHRIERIIKSLTYGAPPKPVAEWLAE